MCEGGEIVVEDIIMSPGVRSRIDFWARRLARKCGLNEQDIEDAKQDATLFLLQCADAFNPEWNVSKKTYCWNCILQWYRRELCSRLSSISICSLEQVLEHIEIVDHGTSGQTEVMDLCCDDKERLIDEAVHKCKTTANRQELEAVRRRAQMDLELVCGVSATSSSFHGFLACEEIDG